MHLKPLVPMSIRKFNFIRSSQRNIRREETKLKFNIRFNQLTIMTEQLYRWSRWSRDPLGAENTKLSISKGL